MKNKNPLSDFSFSDISDVRSELINNKEKFEDEKFRKEFLAFISSELDRCISKEKLSEQKNKLKSVLLRKRKEVILIFKLFDDYLFDEKNKYELNLYLIYIIEVLYYNKQYYTYQYEDWLIKFLIKPFDLNSNFTLDELQNIILYPTTQSNLYLFRTCFGYSLRQMPIPEIGNFLDYYKSQIHGNYSDFLEQIKGIKILFDHLLSPTVINAIDNYIILLQQSTVNSNEADKRTSDENIPWKVEKGKIKFEINEVYDTEIARALYKINDEINLFINKKLNRSVLDNLISLSNLKRKEIDNIKKRLSDLMNDKINTDYFQHPSLPNVLLDLLNKKS